MSTAKSTVKRAFKYRFYPTGAQAAKLSRTFGCVRLVYNRALAHRTRAWYDEARRKVARVYARVSDRRRDFLHKLTTRLVRENQVVVIEDLTVRNLVRNSRLSRAISDAAWRELRMMLEYKCAWYGRQSVTVDRFFPSSKLCPMCGAVREELPLHMREWMCVCGVTHDREVNAAINLRAAGLAVATCGAGVRPQRESSRTGQSATKQEEHDQRRQGDDDRSRREQVVVDEEGAMEVLQGGGDGQLVPAGQQRQRPEKVVLECSSV